MPVRLLAPRLDASLASGTWADEFFSGDIFWEFWNSSELLSNIKNRFEQLRKVLDPFRSVLDQFRCVLTRCEPFWNRCDRKSIRFVLEPLRNDLNALWTSMESVEFRRVQRIL